MADLAASHDAEHLVGPLLVALVLSWVLFAVLSIQVWSLFIPGSARPRDGSISAVVDHLDFASAPPPAFRGAPPYDAEDYNPYVYPPYSPISDGSTRPGSQQFSFPARRQGSPMPLGTGPPPNPRLPHERGILKTLVFAIYALQFLSSVLVTIYTWRQIITGWGDNDRLRGADGVWLQIVAADIIGPLVFSLSFQFFAYRIFLLTPIPGNERSPTIHKSLKLKPFHSFHHSRNLPVWVYSLPAFVSSMSAIFGICALVNGAQLLNHPVPLGYSFPLNATGYVWLIGNLLINLTTFASLLILLVRSRNRASSASIRTTRIIAETGFAPLVASVVVLIVAFIYKDPRKIGTAPVVPALVLPGLYAITVLYTLSQPPQTHAQVLGISKCASSLRSSNGYDDAPRSTTTTTSLPFTHFNSNDLENGTGTMRSADMKFAPSPLPAAPARTSAKKLFGFDLSRKGAAASRTPDRVASPAGEATGNGDAVPVPEKAHKGVAFFVKPPIPSARPRGPRPQSVRVERERDENGEGSGSSSSKQRLDLLEGEGRYEMHVFANLANGNGTNGSEEKRNSGGGRERKVTIGHPFGASEDVDDDDEEEEDEEGQDEKRWWGADTLARRGKARDSLFGLQENATKGRGVDSRRSSTSSLPDNLRQGHGVRWDPFPPHTIGGSNIPGESTSFGETTQSGDESQSFEGTQHSCPSLASVSATDYPSTPHPGAKTPLPRELRLYRHHSTSSSIPQFTSNRDADDNMSHFSGRSRQPYRRTLPPSRRPRHSSQDSSIPQFLRNRSPSPSLKSAKTQRRMTSPEILQNFNARNMFDEERGEGEPSSPPAQSALDDTSIMIISAGNGEPSIFEPSMFKAASVAATRASTGSLWSTYTYPKPLVLPELDDDLREGRYEFDDDNMFRPIDWTGNGNAGNAAARNADDGQRRGHPFVEESPKRRWRVHPLKRIADMGRLRW